MSDAPETQQTNQGEAKPKEDENKNSIETCAGGLTDQQARELQEELDRAKEDNSFSSRSRCVITWAGTIKSSTFCTLGVFESNA